MSKNKKIAIIVIMSVIVMGSTYAISTFSAMKQYEDYTITDYKLILEDLYKRNSLIISNKEVLVKHMPQINKNIESIEKLVDSETKDMNINEGIDLSNEIEPNVTEIVNEYKNNKNSINNEELNTIMKNIMDLDHNCSVSQKIFNKSLNDKDTGYNGSFFNDPINKQLAKIFGLKKINDFKSE